MARYVCIWFHHLGPDWFTLRQPELKSVPFVITEPQHGRNRIHAANTLAEAQGVKKGMVVADARVLVPSVVIVQHIPDLYPRLLQKLAMWCIRFTPCVAIELSDGLIFDASGCAHLFGGELPYLRVIKQRLNERGYQLRLAMADTIGAAWAIARYGKGSPVIESGKQYDALLPLPPAALRIPIETVEQLYKLGLHELSNFITMPRSALRRRFGEGLLQRMAQALGAEQEFIQPVQPLMPYHERLPCLEPIVTLTGIEIALQRLLTALCERLTKEQKGIRTLRLQCYRIDDKIIEVQIGTNRPSRSVQHLFKLFENKLPTIEPALGIELFVLEAGLVEEHLHVQEQLWKESGGLEDIGLTEFLDRLTDKFGANCWHRYLPAAHHWPEHSIQATQSLQQEPSTYWRTDEPHPLHLLQQPEPIAVAAPVPDYPPMHFTYKGQLHKIVRADGPRRIEQEWWLQQGQHRDYYYVEDEAGQRFCIFRSGHYDAEKTYGWFLHGYLA